jgi:hypothetical protein
MQFDSQDFGYDDLKQKVHGMTAGSVMPSDWSVNTESVCLKKDGASKKNAFLFCINKHKPKHRWRYRLYDPHSDSE